MISAMQNIKERMVWRLGLGLLAALLSLFAAHRVFAHQPFFEEGDLTPTTPLRLDACERHKYSH